MTKPEKDDVAGSKGEAGWTKTGPAQPLVVEQPVPGKAPAMNDRSSVGGKNERVGSRDRGRNRT